MLEMSHDEIGRIVSKYNFSRARQRRQEPERERELGKAREFYNFLLQNDFLLVAVFENL